MRQRAPGWFDPRSYSVQALSFHPGVVVPGTKLVHQLFEGGIEMDFHQSYDGRGEL
jgi:hypothetical protein